MEDADFEGSVVLEKMAEAGLLDEFWEAVDNDDLRAASSLMKRAKLDLETVAWVLRKMSAADGEH